MFANRCWSYFCGATTVDSMCGVPELGLLLGKLVLDVLGVVMIEAALLGCGNSVMVLLGFGCLILNRLHSGVIVILVDLFVDSCCSTLFVGSCHSLIGNSWG